jgi:hypothetical protein
MKQRAKTGRGALYIVWGDRADQVLARSIASLNNIHPEMPTEIARIEHNGDGLLCKCRMFELSPFAETAFLDADTVVLGDLSFAFQKAAAFGLACCLSPNPWARKYEGIDGETVEYNTGVLFFTEAARPVFEAWAALTARWPRISSGRVVGDDQAPFAAAVERVGINPFILPLNWNFRPGSPGHRDIVSPLKIWHHYSDPPTALLDRISGDSVPTHARLEDIYPISNAEELRLGWRLLRHGLALSKRRPLFPPPVVGRDPNQ